MTELNLLYTDIEDGLRTAVRDALADHVHSEAVSAMYDGELAVAGRIWSVLGGDLGLAGLLVPEDRDGAGGSAREAAVVLEELGRATAPGPFLTNSVIAASVLLAADDETLTSALAAGERVATLLVAFSTMPGDGVGGGFKASAGLVSGSATTVAGAREADLLLVPVSTDAGTEIWAVDAQPAEVVPVVSLDMSRPLADVSLHEAPGQLLVAADRGERVIEEALTLGAALLASEQVGIAQWCLDETVAYLKVRRQFGRIVGGFQALKHRLADLFCDVEGARAAARYAAACAAEAGAADAGAADGGVGAGREAAIAASIAQAYCADVAVRAAEECIQLHGGIGMTWEHPAHLFLKRAKADQVALGTPAAHRHRLGDLVGLPSR